MLNEHFLSDEEYLNFKKLFCYMLASKDFLRADIDKIFDEDKVKYLRAFKNSDVNKSNLSKSSDVKTEIYTEKVIGILECDILENNYENTRKLYSKAFKKIYRGLKDKTLITIEEIYTLLDDRTDAMLVIIATIYFFDIFNKIFIPEVQANFLQEISTELYRFENYKSLNFNEKSYQKHHEELTNLKKKLHIRDKEYTLDELVVTITGIDLYNLGKIRNVSNINEIVSNDSYPDVLNCGQFGKFIGAYESYFKYLGYDTTKLCKITFSKSEVNEMIMNLCIFKENNKFTDDECIIFFINIFYTMALNKGYRESRHEYVKFINEESILKINELQVNLEKSKNEISRMKDELEIKEKNIKKSNNELLNQLEQLKKENQRLKKEVEKTEPLKNEVVKLRNLSFSMINNDEIKEEACVYNIDELEKLKLAIVGGTNTWINKMKEKLPNAKFITDDNKNIDFKFFKNVDMVFINIKMPHSLYFKVKSTIDKYDIKYDFIYNKENIEYSLMDLYRKSMKT